MIYPHRFSQASPHSSANYWHRDVKTIAIIVRVWPSNEAKLPHKETKTTTLALCTQYSNNINGPNTIKIHTTLHLLFSSADSRIIKS